MEYLPSRQNTVADALSRRELGLSLLSCPQFQLFDDPHQEIDTTADLTTRSDSIEAGMAAGLGASPMTSFSIKDESTSH